MKFSALALFSASVFCVGYSLADESRVGVVHDKAQGSTQTDACALAKTYTDVDKPRNSDIVSYDSCMCSEEQITAEVTHWVCSVDAHYKMRDE